jgi:hypothetical protein
LKECKKKGCTGFKIPYCRLIGGGVHVPLNVSSVGRYIRKITLNEFLSDGSQLDSLSFPGLSPSVLVFNPGDASVLLYVTIKIQKIK